MSGGKYAENHRGRNDNLTEIRTKNKIFLIFCHLVQIIYKLLATLSKFYVLIKTF